ncbi:chemotaxis protein CheW [Niveispirillum sp.]|uniref:chemotaxis protein CheW n=1 Tax=Niveispirillum sp. TaxID=1917217 RepID=UPI001B61F82D|nr:chemotaxis protein CheW [Niveispirillum sp.]MBP7337791.1 chemotaxis protein CheW [Niveispirillum sp.]
MSPGIADMAPPPDDTGALHLRFTIGGRSLALPLDRVLEVTMPPAHVSPLPLAPAAVRGLAHVRGRVTAILNAHRLLDLPEPPAAGGSRLLLLGHGGLLLGLPVDEMQGIHREGSAVWLDLLLDRALSLPSRPPIRDLRVAPTRAASGGGMARSGRALVSFMVADQEYALPANLLRRAAPLPDQIVALPHAPAAVLGMGMVGDRLLPLVSLRAVLGLTPAAMGRVLVVARDGLLFGLVVDRLRELLRVDEASVEPVPALFSDMGREVEALCRLEGGRRLVSLLSPAHLLARDDMESALSGTGAETVEPAFEVARAVRRTALLRVRAGDGEYALPLAHVTAVNRPGPLTRVPQAPDILVGIGNADGVALPVIDLRRRLGLPANDRGARHVVLVAVAGRRFGVLVDLVLGLRHVPVDAIGPAPALSAAQARLIARVVEDAGAMLPILEPPLLAEAAGMAS